MSATFSANCPRCGQVVGDAQSTHTQAYTTRSGGAYVAYVCPSHGGRVVCRGTQEDLARLASVGMTAREVPEEVLEVHRRPVVSLDDLIDLHFDMDDADWIERLAADPDRSREAGCAA